MQRGSLSRRAWVASLLALLVACTSPATRSRGSSPAQPNPTLSAGGGAQFLSGPCPVTQPVPPREVPKGVVDAVEPGQQSPLGQHDFDYWYGNDALWVELPPRSEVVKSSSEELSEKFPWVRLIAGQLSIEGQRLDGPAPPVLGHASTGYGRIGFQASGIYFPMTGCWEIIGRIAGQELRFVVEARRQSA
jgi:hypothetical protein